MTYDLSEDEIAILEAAFDYYELQRQHDCGLPVTKARCVRVLRNITSTCGRVMADNEGERPTYEPL